MSKPTAVILAAGANSRFFPFNTRIHKGGLEICGLPLIVRTLQGLQGQVERVMIVRSDDESGQELENLVHQHQSQLADFAIKFFTQPQPKGMGDALLQVSSEVDSDLLVMF